MMFFNKKNKKNKKNNKIDNQYAVENLELHHYTTIDIVNKDHLRIETILHPFCDKKFRFKGDWEGNISKKESSFPYNFDNSILDSTTIILHYDVYANSISDAKVDIISPQDICDKNKIVRKSIDSFSEFSDYVLNNNYDDLLTKKFMNKLINLINFKQDLEFVERFASDKDELERDLNYIKNQTLSKEMEINERYSDILEQHFNKIKQIESQISFLVEEKKKIDNIIILNEEHIDEVKKKIK